MDSQPEREAVVELLQLAKTCLEDVDCHNHTAGDVAHVAWLLLVVRHNNNPIPCPHGDTGVCMYCLCEAISEGLSR